MRRINRSFPWLVLATLAIPAALGFALTGTAAGALTGLLWGGLVRVFFVHHITWSINSICHFHGARRFATEDQSTQRLVALARLARRGLAPQPPRLPALRVPWAARWELDPSGIVILAMRKLGLAWNVVLITPERQQQRLAGADPAPPKSPAGRGLGPQRARRTAVSRLASAGPAWVVAVRGRV